MLALTSWLLIPALFGAGMILYGYWRGRDFRWILLPLLFLYLGAAWAHGDQKKWEKREKSIGALTETYVEARGTITSIEEEDGTFEILLKDNRVYPRSGKDRDKTDCFLIPGLMVTFKDFKKEEKNSSIVSLKGLGIGETVLIRGEGKAFSRARNPGEFNFWEFYKAMGLDLKIYGKELVVLDPGKDPLLEGIRQVKLWIIETFYRLTGEKDGGIFVAAVIGDKDGIPKEINDLYQKNGIAHLLAISGMHMSVIGLFFYRILRKMGLGYGRAGLAGSLLVILYGILTGNSPSVARAVIMMVITFLASYLGRTYDLLSSASLALILLSLKSPLLLMQGGVQLSFGAVFAIGGMMPAMAEWAGKEKPLVKAVSTAVAIQVVTLPVVLYHFYQLPLYGIFLNFLAIPLMDAVVYSGLAVIFLGSLCPFLGIGAAGIGHYILVFYEFACKNIAKLPYNNLTFGRPDTRRLAAYGFFLAALFFILKIAASFGKNKEEEEKSSPYICRVLLLFVLYGFSILFFRPSPVKGLEAMFLDVGQGDGILLRTGKSTILVDGGSTSKKSLGEYTLEPCLKNLGISAVDYAFISHGDLDHLSGVRFLLETSDDIRIKNIMLPCQGKGDEKIKELEELARKRGTKVIYLAGGDELTVEELKITCLYPGRTDIPETVNAQSEVLKMDYGSCHMLFTGDMGEKEETRLLERLGKKGLSEINVLKTAHHGSKYSSSEAFLEAVSPRWAVISYGENNTYGHPHKEVLERFKGLGVEVFKTAEEGAIRLWTDGMKIHFSSYVDADGFYGYN